MAFWDEDVACMSQTVSHEMALQSQRYVSHAVGPVVPYDGLTSSWPIFVAVGVLAESPMNVQPLHKHA